jgi:uncharacterized protein (TIGR02145 family)
VQTVLPIASVASLDCVGATHTGTLTAYTATAGASSAIVYTGGNGGTYGAQTITSTGVTGLTATLTAGTLVNGNGTVTYTITGTPSANGMASFAITIGGQTCTLTRTVVLPAASLTTLDCVGATHTGTLMAYTATAGASSAIAYTGGNGGTYGAQTITSTGVTGLTATLTAGTLVNGNGTVTYTITGTPSAAGTASFAITIGGQTCTLTRTVVLPAASLTTLDCVGATHTGTLIASSVASGVSSAIAYTSGNGGTYGAQTITSTGVTGLTATLTAGTLVNGNGTVTYTITGTPSSAGTASFAISLGGQSCTLTRPVGIFDRAYGQTINGANNHNFVYFLVTGADGKTWLNNNLGAHYANQNHASFNPSQQATSGTDHLAYGSLFQWGRAADGHELITWTNGNGTPVNSTTATRPQSDTAANALFITINSGNYDWRGTTQNNNLWQGVSGINNPCPAGYRLPTSAELTTLVTTAGITNSATAAGSTLKFTFPGARGYSNGSIGDVDSYGFYWSSSISGTYAIYRVFISVNTSAISYYRGSGFSVRCLQD